MWLIFPATAAVWDSGCLAGAAAATDLPVSILQPVSMIAISIRMLVFFCLVISSKWPFVGMEVSLLQWTTVGRYTCLLEVTGYQKAPTWSTVALSQLAAEHEPLDGKVTTAECWVQPPAISGDAAYGKADSCGMNEHRRMLSSSYP